MRRMNKHNEIYPATAREIQIADVYAERTRPTPRIKPSGPLAAKTIESCKRLCAAFGFDFQAVMLDWPSVEDGAREARHLLGRKE